MTDADEINLGLLLNERWPGKFGGADFRIWCDHFANMPLEKIRVAIAKWANYDKGKFPPKIDEIQRIIMQNEPKPPAPPTRSTAIATAFLRANPGAAGHCDAALHLGYYRGEYLRRMNELQSLPNIRRRALNAEEVAQGEKAMRVNVALAKFDLIGFGVPESAAGRLAGSLAGSLDEFRAAVAELDEIMAAPVVK